ncbi:MAG: DUF6030 family protein [Neorhizobium sp.]|nr:DUF6030 family protein [Neorhizobium sp.]
MPKEERPAPITPAARRRRRRRGVLIFAILLAVVLGGLATVVLTVNDGRNWHRIIRQYGLEAYFVAPSPAPDLKVGRQKQVSPAAFYPSRLLDRVLERPDRFDAQAHLPPREACERLKTSAGPVPTFTETNSDWECLLSQQFGSAPDPASIFVQVKGSAREGLRSFRVKLSQTDPGEERNVLQHALDAVDRFDLDLTPDTRRYIAMKLAAKSRFNSFSANYTLSFQGEITDDRRFNLIIAPRLPDGDCASPPSPLPFSPRNATVRVPIGCLPWRTGLEASMPTAVGR